MAKDLLRFFHRPDTGHLSATHNLAAIAHLTAVGYEEISREKARSIALAGRSPGRGHRRTPQTLLRGIEPVSRSRFLRETGFGPPRVPGKPTRIRAAQARLRYCRRQYERHKAHCHGRWVTRTINGRETTDLVRPWDRFTGETRKRQEAEAKARRLHWSRELGKAWDRLRRAYLAAGQEDKARAMQAKRYAARQARRREAAEYRMQENHKTT